MKMFVFLLAEKLQPDFSAFKNSFDDQIMSFIQAKHFRLDLPDTEGNIHVVHRGDRGLDSVVSRYVKARQRINQEGKDARNWWALRKFNFVEKILKPTWKRDCRFSQKNSLNSVLDFLTKENDKGNHVGVFLAYHKLPPEVRDFRQACLKSGIFVKLMPSVGLHTDIHPNASQEIRPELDYTSGCALIRNIVHDSIYDIVLNGAIPHNQLILRP